jgi:hypothetical protein
MDCGIPGCRVCAPKRRPVRPISWAELSENQQKARRAATLRRLRLLMKRGGAR